MHKVLLYGGFGFLLVTGVLHFLVDVVYHYYNGHRPPTSYWGLHTAYALGQVVFGLLAILLIRSGSDLMSRIPGQAVTFLALAGWAVVAFRFMEYIPPRVNVGIAAALLIGAAITA